MNDIVRKTLFSKRIFLFIRYGFCQIQDSRLRMGSPFFLLSSNTFPIFYTNKKLLSQGISILYKKTRMTSRNKEPLHIKPRQNVLSPVRINAQKNSPDNKHINLNATDPFSQRTNHLSCINYEVKRVGGQKENYLPISTSPARFGSPPVNMYRPANQGMVNGGNQNQVHVNSPAAIMVTTIPTRDLQSLQNRLQTAQIMLHELNLLKSTLQMERKQFYDAYQQLKISSEQTKRFLTKAFDDLKAEHEAMLKDKDTVRLENRMLNQRLSERGQKIQEALKDVRERASKSGGNREELKKYRELKEKVSFSLNFVYEAVGIDSKHDDPDYLLENAQKLFDDIMSLHNSQKAVQKEQIQRLRLQLEHQKTCSVGEDSEKVDTSIIDQYHMADPSNQTIPSDHEKWKSNIQTQYNEKLKEQERNHQKEMDELRAKFNNELLELQNDVKGLYDKRCQNCQQMSRTIVALNDQLTTLRSQLGNQ